MWQTSTPDNYLVLEVRTIGNFIDLCQSDNYDAKPCSKWQLLLGVVVSIDQMWSNCGHMQLVFRKLLPASNLQDCLDKQQMD